MRVALIVLLGFVVSFAPAKAQEISGGWSLLNLRMPEAFVPLAELDARDVAAGHGTITYEPGQAYTGMFTDAGAAASPRSVEGDVELLGPGIFRQNAARRGRPDQPQRLLLLSSPGTNAQAGSSVSAARALDLSLFLQQPENATFADASGPWNLLKFTLPRRSGSGMPAEKLSGEVLSLRLFGEDSFQLGAASGTASITASGELSLTQIEATHVTPSPVYLNSALQVGAAVAADESSGEQRFFMAVREPNALSPEDLWGNWRVISLEGALFLGTQDTDVPALAFSRKLDSWTLHEDARLTTLSGESGTFAINGRRLEVSQELENEFGETEMRTFSFYPSADYECFAGFRSTIDLVLNEPRVELVIAFRNPREKDDLQQIYEAAVNLRIEKLPGEGLRLSWQSTGASVLESTSEIFRHSAIPWQIESGTLNAEAFSSPIEASAQVREIFRITDL